MDHHIPSAGCLWKICTIVAVLSLLCLSDVLGQSEVTDEGFQDSILLKEVVVTAQFMPTDTRETVNRVTVLNQETISRRAAVQLAELLSTEAQFRVSQDLVLGAAISVNGLPSENVKILVDGVPVIGRLDGAIDAGQLPLSDVRKVEIIEGAQSLIYGSAASAGVVNLMTAVSQLHRFEGEVNGMYEFDGYRSLNMRAGADFGKTGLSLSAGKLEFEAEDENDSRDELWNPKDQQFARLVFRASPTDRFTLRAAGNILNEDVINLGEIRRPQFNPYAFDDYYNSRRRDVSVHGEGWLSQSLYSSTTAAYNYFYRRKNSYRTEMADGVQEPLIGQQDTSTADGILIRSTLATGFPSRAWNVLGGAELFRETLEDARIEDSEQEQSRFAEIADIAAFASVKWKILPSLTAQGGARFTHNSRFGDALTPSVWLAWRPSEAWTLKTSYANGFRSPALKELFFAFIDVNHYIIGNPGLRPEKSHNFRVDVQRKVGLAPDWALDLTVSGFYNSIEDRIVLAEFAELQFNYQNVSTWKTSGGGLSVQLQKSDWLSLRSTVLVTGYFNALSETEEVEAMSPAPDMTNDLSLDLFQGKAGFDLWHRWTGSTPFFYLEDGVSQRGERSGWHMLSCSALVNLWKNSIQLSAGVKNMLDVREVESSGESGSHGSSFSTTPVHWGRTFFVKTRFLLHSGK